MRRKIILVSAIALVLILSMSALAVVLWTSSSVHKTITVTGTPNLDGAIISVSSFVDYVNRTVPTEFPEGFGDVRDNSFLVGINTTNFIDDINITISATGVPEGMNVSAKMGYAAYWGWFGTWGPEERIYLFFENETGLMAYQTTWLNDVDFIMEYQNISMSDYPFVDLALDVPYTIPAAHVPATFLNSTIPQESPAESFDYCNGLWLQFQFDTTNTNLGTYEIDVTVTLGTA